MHESKVPNDHVFHQTTTLTLPKCDSKPTRRLQRSLNVLNALPTVSSHPPERLKTTSLIHRLPDSPPQAQRAQPGYNNGPRQVRVQQAPTGGYGYGQPATQAQQGEYGYDQRHSYSPSPSPDFSPEPPSAPYTQPSGRPKGHGTRTREIIYLEPGFAWNRESLALLYKIKERSKKGFKLIASKGKFPGKTEKELQDTWTARKVEAKVYYEEVYGKPGQK